MSQWGSLPAHKISSVVTACCEMFQWRPQLRGQEAPRWGGAEEQRSREDHGSQHWTVSFVASRRRQSDKRIEWLWASMTRRSGGSILVCQSKWTRVIYIYCIHQGPWKPGDQLPLVSTRRNCSNVDKSADSRAGTESQTCRWNT